MILLWFACTRVTLPVEAPTPARTPVAGTASDDRRSPLPPFSGVDREQARYVGSEVCSACHPDAQAVWAGSGHSGAMNTLAEHKAAYNPDCVRCHSTGFGYPSGYKTTKDATLAAVGCEACHGPGSGHIVAPAPGYGSLGRDGTACVGCHQPDNSPDFSFDAYWASILHDRAAAPPAGG